jgi:hypothetical protein
MKPDWKDAPEWANYLAQDKNGEWTWFSHKPVAEWSRWNYFQSGARHAQAPLIVENWKETLEKRPTKGETK